MYWPKVFFSVFFFTPLPLIPSFPAEERCFLGLSAKGITVSVVDFPSFSLVFLDLCHNFKL